MKNLNYFENFLKGFAACATAIHSDLSFDFYLDAFNYDQNEPFEDNIKKFFIENHKQDEEFISEWRKQENTEWKFEMRKVWDFTGGFYDLLSSLPNIEFTSKLENTVEDFIKNFENEYGKIIGMKK